MHSVLLPSMKRACYQTSSKITLSLSVLWRELHLRKQEQKTKERENSPGQCLSKQTTSSEFEPTQAFPPRAGAGLVQDRVRFVLPVPQDLLHDDHGLQLDQLPSTGPENDEKKGHEIDSLAEKFITVAVDLFHCHGHGHGHGHRHCHRNRHNHHHKHHSLYHHEHHHHYHYHYHYHQYYNYYYHLYHHSYCLHCIFNQNSH